MFIATVVLIGIEKPGIIDPTPVTEDGPLRSQLYRYRGLSDDPFAHNYDKISARASFDAGAKDLSGTIVRLPMVYGVGNVWHRLYPYVKPMNDHRPAIVLAEKIARWQGCYGYVENVA